MPLLLPRLPLMLLLMPMLFRRYFDADAPPACCYAFDTFSPPMILICRLPRYCRCRYFRCCFATRCRVMIMPTAPPRRLRRATHMSCLILFDFRLLPAACRYLPLIIRRLPRRLLFFRCRRFHDADILPRLMFTTTLLPRWCRARGTCRKRSRLCASAMSVFTRGTRRTIRAPLRRRARSADMMSARHMFCAVDY